MSGHSSRKHVFEAATLKRRALAGLINDDRHPGSTLGTPLSATDSTHSNSQFVSLLPRTPTSQPYPQQRRFHTKTLR